MKHFLLIAALGATAFTASSQTVDPGKVCYSVGQGYGSATVVAQWNEPYALENLVWGYRFNDGATAGEAVNEILKTDPRFYAASQGGRIVGYAFDLNGNGDTAFVSGDNRYELVDGVADIPTSIGIVPSDSIGDQWAAGDWQLIRSGEVIDRNSALADGDILYLCRDAATVAEYGYAMYLPAPDEVGVWLPRNVSMHLADNASIRYITGIGNSTIKTLAFSRRTADGKTDSSVLKNAKWTPDLNASRAALTFAGTAASVGNTTYLTVKMTLADARTAMDTCEFTLLEPVVPVERLYFKNPEIEARLDRAVDWRENLVIEPAGATYTELTGVVTRTTPTILSWSSTTQKLSAYTTVGTGKFTVSHAYSNQSAELTVNTRCFEKVQDMRFCDETIENTGIIRTDMFDTPEFEFGTGYMILPEDPDCIKYCTLTIKDYNKDTSLAGVMQTKISHDKWGIVYKYTIMPSGLGYGEETLVLKCDNEDCGKVYKEYKLIIAKGSSGVDEAYRCDGDYVTVCGRELTIKGCVGDVMGLYSLNGQLVMDVRPDSDNYVTTISMVPAGIYVLRGAGKEAKKIMIR